MTPEQRVAEEIRNELDARLEQWKAERRQLGGAAARIAELDALIAYAEQDRTVVPIAPRRAVVVEEAASIIPGVEGTR